MYSKQEAATLKKEFWTTLGQYLNPVLSSDGERINWINYKTGEKDIVFKMHADNKRALIAIELTHKDHGIRELYYQQYQQLKSFFSAIMGEEWNWQMFTTDDHGRQISRISTSIDDVSIYNRSDWPTIISFFKPRIIALDEFWSQAKYSFESLK